MSLKTDPRKITGYLLIYFMLICNQTGLYLQFFSKWSLVIAIAFSILVIINIKSRVSRYSVLLLGGLLASIIFVRFMVGGVGLNLWAERAVMITVTAYAVCYNGSSFLTRFVKTVTFLAIISIVLWLVQIVVPELWKNMPFVMEFDTDMGTRNYISAISYRFIAYKGYGLFLYTMHGNYRNTSIFTEPGIYQMVLSTASFCILFLSQHLNISRKQSTRYLIVIMVALITSMSTTGYINFAFIGIAVVLTHQQEQKMRKSIMYLLAVIILLVLGDYIVRANESFLYVGVISKLFTTSGEFSLEASTGFYRYGSLLVYLMIMAKHPLGAGVDTVSRMIDYENTAYCGFALLRDGAILGVLPMIGIVVWLLYPFVRYKIGKVPTILYLLLYINTMAGQSSAFYPTLIMLPMFLIWEVDQDTNLTAV